ncbi:MAG: nitroreductase family protein [Chloroflexota bacterium]
MSDSGNADRQTVAASIQHALAERFGADVAVDPALPGLDILATIAGHRSHRAYADRPIPPDLLRLLCACALSAPSKSDLQQADIVQVADPALRTKIADLLPDNPWVREAPVFLVFCGNNRRIRQSSELRGKTFANDHLDAFMNAAVDAGIVLSTFIRAAAAVGVGCCPISAVRNHAATISELLGLPDWVFPLAGLCVGYPQAAGQISPRLPLDVTVHVDRFDETNLTDRIEGYDRRREALQPYARQRYPEEYGELEAYGWSEDKARQYSKPERADFGAFIRAKRFRLE